MSKKNIFKRGKEACQHLFFNSYDALSTAAKRKRKQPQLEKSNEDGQLKGRERLQAISLLRNLYRNSPDFKSAIHQHYLGTLGPGGAKVHFTTKNQDFNNKARVYYNSIFSKNCDAVSDTHLSDMNKMAIIGHNLCGDYLFWFDITIGKFRQYEADQIANVSDALWNEFKIDQINNKGINEDYVNSLIQSQGVVFDNVGTTVGYFVSNDYGQATISKNETFISASVAKIYKGSPWRPNMRRGSIDTITIVDIMQDLAEIHRQELLKAKGHSKLQFLVTSSEAATVGLKERADDESNEQNVEDAVDPTEYKRLQSLAEVTYAAEGDDIKLLQTPIAPSTYEPFVNFIKKTAGAVLGLTRLRSTLQADASYSATRAEGLLDDANFAREQKTLERYLLDWQVEQAISWAIEQGKLPNPGDEWLGMWKFEHSKRLPIDELRTAKATELNLKNQIISLIDVLGVDWEKKLENSYRVAAKQQEFAKTHGVALGEDLEIQPATLDATINAKIQTMIDNTKLLEMKD